MKYWIYFLLILCFMRPLLGFTQNDMSSSPEDEDSLAIPKQQDKFFLSHVKIDINNRMYDGSNYIETKFSPFFKLENLYLGFTLPLEISTSSGGGVENYYDYIYPQNYLKFLDTLQYVFPDQSLQIKIGSLTDISLGEGILMSHFRNDLFSPNTKIQGFYSHGIWKYGGYQVFLSDITNGGMGGTEISFTPLANLEASLWRGWNLKATWIYDIDTLHQLYTQDNKIHFGVNPHSHHRYGGSVSTSFLLLDENNIDLHLATEYGQLFNEQSSKNQYAILNKISLNYAFYYLDIGFSYLNHGFLMDFFSTLYLQPNIRKNQPNTVSSTNAFGYSLRNVFSFFKDNFQFGFEFHGQTNHIFAYNAFLQLNPYILGQLSILFEICQENIKTYQDFYNNFASPLSLLITEVAYRFSDNTQLGLLYRRSVGLKKNNTDIHSTDELSVQVSIIF